MHSRGGMHWDYSNRGDPPTSREPNGRIEKTAVDGTTGLNIENDGARLPSGERAAGRAGTLEPAK